MNQVATKQQINTGRVPDQARHMIDKIFENLTASCPILLTISGEQLEILKQQWILSFAENGVKTFDQVKRGMAAARAKTNGYLPSVGEFVAWCNDIDYHALGLPNAEELEQRFKKFMGYAKFDKHQFNYKSNAEYYLLKKLYDNYGKAKWEDCQRAMPKVLTDVAEKVKAGYEFDEMPKMIPAKSSFYDKEKADKARDSLMAMVKGNGV